MSAKTKLPHISPDTFLTVANVVYLLLAMSALTLLGCLPMLLAIVFAADPSAYPLYLAAAALSAPASPRPSPCSAIIRCS